MRKLVILGLMAATAIPSIASAQSAREVRDSRREVRQEQRDVNRAIRNGAPGYVVREEQRDVRDAREDWRDYRNSHRDVYRRPAYVGPRGYAYRPVNVGYRFAPTYYGRNYWINDWNRYRLNAPGRNQRWIRYGNDAALINSLTGVVIAINRGFFW